MVYPVTAAAEVSSPRSVATMAQNATAHSHGAEWNLLSYLAGFGWVNWGPPDQAIALGFVRFETGSIYIAMAVLGLTV